MVSNVAMEHETTPHLTYSTGHTHTNTHMTSCMASHPPTSSTHTHARLLTVRLFLC